jgi:hypothetical protein
MSDRLTVILPPVLSAEDPPVLSAEERIAEALGYNSLTEGDGYGDGGGYYGDGWGDGRGRGYGGVEGDGESETRI